jgi:hypothetical protein
VPDAPVYPEEAEDVVMNVVAPLLFPCIRSAAVTPAVVPEGLAVPAEKFQAMVCAVDAFILRAKKHTGSRMYCRHLIMVFVISNFVKKWKGGLGSGAAAKIWYYNIIPSYRDN